MNSRIIVLVILPLSTVLVCFITEFWNVTLTDWWNACRYVVAFLAVHLGAGDPKRYAEQAYILDIPAWARALYDLAAWDSAYHIWSSFVASVILSGLAVLLYSTIAISIVVPFRLLPWLRSFERDVQAHREKARESLECIVACGESAKTLYSALKSLELVAANHRASLNAIAGREISPKPTNLPERELASPQSGPKKQDKERTRHRKADFEHSFEF